MMANNRLFCGRGPAAAAAPAPRAHRQPTRPRIWDRSRWIWARGRRLIGAAEPSRSPPAEAFAVPGGLPVVGNLLQLDLQRVHESVYDMYQEHGGDVLKIKLLDKFFYHTRNAADASQILKNQEVFRKSPLVEVMGDWLGDGLATQRDIPKHANVRRLLNPAFRTEYIRGLSPTFSRAGKHLADAMLQLGEHDIQDLTMRATLDVIGATGFRYDFGSLDLATGRRTAPVTVAAEGGSLDVAKLFDRLLAGMGNQLAFNSLSPRQEWIPGYNDYKSAIADLDRLIDAMLTERRATGIREDDLDLISFCLRAMEAEPDIMNDRQIRNELHTMLFAGSDTTANTLSWMFFEMARRPEIMQRAMEEVDGLFECGTDPSPETLNARLPYLTACFKEALRVWPPVTVLARLAVEDAVLEGSRTKINAQGTAVVNIWCLHRNPKYWTRPEEYCPERWQPEGEQEFGLIPEEAWVPFGGGPRVCIGMYFAIMEGQLIAAQVLRKARFEPVEGFVPDIANLVTMSSKNGIRIRALPRH